MSFNNNEGGTSSSWAAMLFAADEARAMVDGHPIEDLDESFGESTISAESTMYEYLDSSFGSEWSEDSHVLVPLDLHLHTYAVPVNPLYMDYSLDEEDDAYTLDSDIQSQGSAEMVPMDFTPDDNSLDNSLDNSIDNSFNNAYNLYFDYFGQERKSAPK